MCGVVGLISPPKPPEGLAVELALRLLHDSRNRGEDGSGFLIHGEDDTRVERWLGPAYEGPLGRLRQFKGPRLILAHARYATAGEVALENIHPAEAGYGGLKLHLVMNGEVFSSARWRRAAKGLELFGKTDATDCAAKVLSLYLEHRDLGRALAEFYREAFPFGGFTILGLLIGEGEAPAFFYLRDGLRPLHRAIYKGFELFASETRPLTDLGIPWEEVEPIPPGVIGIYSLDEREWETTELDGRAMRGLCSFEFAYFQEPNSAADGRSMDELRMELGRAALGEHPPPAGGVIAPVPKSGISAGRGYGEAALKAGLDVSLGEVILRRSGRATRSFLGDGQPEIVRRLRRKFAINHQEARGRKIINIDDSIVRGNVSAWINRLEREAGAQEVHFVSAWPPIIGPCSAGIALGMEELLVAELGLNPLGVAEDHEKLEEELARGYEHPQFGFIRFDSVSYLSSRAVMEILGRSVEGGCTGCFTGCYNYICSANLEGPYSYEPWLADLLRGSGLELPDL